MGDDALAEYDADELEGMVAESRRKNEALARENLVFSRFLSRVEPQSSGHHGGGGGGGGVGVGGGGAVRCVVLFPWRCYW